MAPHTNRPTITVWVIEDDLQYRQTLAYLLDHTSDLRCGQTFEACEEALDLLDAYEGRAKPEWWPDVVLLDVNLPGLSGIEGLGRLKAHLPKTQILMLTIRDDADTIYEALRAGASGYLVKNAGVDQIIAAVREASQGGTLMTAPVARKVLSFFQQQTAMPPDYGLTEREKDVLREMTEGRTQKEIADKLFISPHTVNTHIQHIYKKLHVHSGVEAVAKAIRERLF